MVSHFGTQGSHIVTNEVISSQPHPNLQSINLFYKCCSNLSLDEGNGLKSINQAFISSKLKSFRNNQSSPINKFASEIEGPGERGHAQCQRGQADYLFLRQFCIPLLRVTPKIPSVQHAVSPDINSMLGTALRVTNQATAFNQKLHLIYLMFCFRQD